jgi:hypothetical protein
MAAATDTFISFLLSFFSSAQQTNGQIDKKNSKCACVYVNDVLTIK